MRPAVFMLMIFSIIIIKHHEYTKRFKDIGNLETHEPTTINTLPPVVSHIGFNEFLFSKETVVLRGSQCEKNIGFIKRMDNG